MDANLKLAVLVESFLDHLVQTEYKGTFFGFHFCNMDDSTKFNDMANELRKSSNEILGNVYEVGPEVPGSSPSGSPVE